MILINKIDTCIGKIKFYLWMKSKPLPYVCKRILDILIALCAIIVSLPFTLLIAIMIKLDSNGSVFFTQKRVGKFGQQFMMWKFRSMCHDAEYKRDELDGNNEMKDGVIFKIKRDPRITRIGGFLRKTSIDELPQLINVLKGEMSLVGPRPPLPSEVSTYTASNRQRLDVKPGITCLWQISGRSDIPFKEQVKLDVQYIEQQNTILDILILLKTIPAVISGKGAY